MLLLKMFIICSYTTHSNTVFVICQGRHPKHWSSLLIVTGLGSVSKGNLRFQTNASYWLLLPFVSFLKSWNRGKKKSSQMILSHPPRISLGECVLAYSPVSWVRIDSGVGPGRAQIRQRRHREAKLSGAQVHVWVAILHLYETDSTHSWWFLYGTWVLLQNNSFSALW